MNVNTFASLDLLNQFYVLYAPFLINTITHLCTLDFPLVVFGDRLHVNQVGKERDGIFLLCAHSDIIYGKCVGVL